jgi:predicted nucleic acid-binding protein
VEPSSITDGPVVLDASVVLAAALEEPAGTRAAELLGRLAADEHQLLVPALFDVECASGLVKAVRRGRLDHGSAMAVFADVLRIPAERVSIMRLHGEALVLALHYGISAHDAEYVVLAGAHEGVLITADARLVRALRDSPYDVRSLEDGDVS